MIDYNLGDIVLIEFPHTDLKHTSKRPAFVLYDSGDQDVLVARVTTQRYFTKTDYNMLKWKERGLLSESYIRLDKLATVEKRYVVKYFGKLDAFEVDEVKSILKRMFLL